MPHLLSRGARRGMESHPVPHRKQNALLERALDCQSGAPGSRHRPHRPTCELRKASTPLKNRDASAASTVKVQVTWGRCFVKVTWYQPQPTMVRAGGQLFVEEESQPGPHQ